MPGMQTPAKKASLRLVGNKASTAPREVFVAEIPTDDGSWINDAVERLERAWKMGSRPRIEDFLANEPAPRRPPLLVQLLRVECELRAQAGEGPTADEYRCRFPEHDDVVDSVIAPTSKDLR
jgi:hypothetical protein